MGAKTFVHAKKNDFSYQRNWAMKQAKNDWVLFIDADEEVSEELKYEISHLKFDDAISAYALLRRDYFWDTEMKYGETRKARTNGIIRLVKKDTGIWSGAIHEVFIAAGQVSKLTGFLNHYSHESLAAFVNDVNIYSTVRAKELACQGKKSSTFSLIILPFAKFIYTYFFLLGFLDGAAGFVYSFVMSFHSFLVRAKLATKLYV